MIRSLSLATSGRNFDGLSAASSFGGGHSVLYFLGAISGFVSLVPYLGVFLALVASSGWRHRDAK